MEITNYAPRVFWGWNGKITKEETEKQLSEFKAKGISGVFVHARAGLVTEYMGEEWLSAFGWVVEWCRNNGMEVWIYDEYGWPSGFGGGKVYAKSEQFKEKYLNGKYCYISELEKDADVYGCYTFADGVFTECKQPSVGEKYYFAIKSVNDYYIDVTDKDAINYFIEVTHEVYKQRFSEYFGKTIKGVFTDEPHVPPQGLPLGKYITEEFEKQNGYPLKEAIPYILFDKGGYCKYRYDYWKTVSYLFKTNYVRRYNEWCEENGLIMTGHFACEEGVVDQIPVCGGVMPLYEEERLIGVDTLGNRFAPPLVFKQAESVVFQTGRREILSETYAGSGYDASFKELLAIWAYQAAFGVNVPCLSISMYSLEGNRKRDYPQFFCPQMPFWDKADVLFGQMTYINERLHGGVRRAEILVIHPKTGAWALSGYGDKSRIHDISSELRNLTESLVDLQADFDFGDEQFILKTTYIAQKRIVLGECSYSVLIIPKVLYLEERTLEMIKEFQKNGGIVFNLNDEEVYCGNENNKAFLPGVFVVNRKDYIRKVFDVHKINVSPILLEEDGRKPCSGLVTAKRFYDDRTDIFALNKSRDNGVSAVLKTDGKNRIVASYPGGKNSVLKSRYSAFENKTYTDVKIEPSEYVFFSAETVENIPEELFGNNDSLKEKTYIDGLFGELGYSGVFTVDKVAYSIDGGAYSAEKYAIKAVNDFYREINGKGKPTVLSLKYTFEAKGITGNIFAGLESSDGVVYINGKKAEACGFFVDKAIKKYDATQYIKDGENEIVLEKTIPPFYNELLDRDVFQSVTNVASFPYCIESAYVLGDFSVEANEKTWGKNCVYENDFTLTGKKKIYGLADLSAKGMEFFSGSVSGSAEFEFDGDKSCRVLFGIEKFDAVVVEAEINDSKFPIIAPYDKTDITDYLKKGKNTIKLTLYSGLRNTFGPHHHIYGKHYYTGPSVFEGVGEWQDVVVFPELSGSTFTEKYSFVAFGAKGIYIEKQRNEKW